MTSTTTAGPPLLAVRDLELRYGRRPSAIDDRVLRGVSFDVHGGETLGIVGESGCGKSTLGRCLVRLLEPTAGSVTFDGTDLASLRSGPLRELRRRVQIVFQDPASSLDPRMSIGALVEEPLTIHGTVERGERAAAVADALELVGLRPDLAGRKPHMLSGGQLQRVAIARALITRPDLVVLDEPVSALDASIRAQVLNLLRDLQEALALTYVFIVHDLAIAEWFCDRVLVLYAGEVVELASSATIFAEPLHPYTRALIASVPDGAPDDGARTQLRLRSDAPDAPAGAGAGCPLVGRCPEGEGQRRCAEEKPPLVEVRPGHWAACHLSEPAEPAALTPQEIA
jgi:oligopeptide/dipeptide ABC transporter ATP-binding protein